MLIDKFIEFINKTAPGYVPNVILDVGSRDLEQSLEFLKVYPNATILAFEPNPNQAQFITANLKDGIKFFPIALGSTEGTATLHSPPQDQNHGAGSLLVPHYSAIVQGYNKHEVKVRRLDNVLFEEENIAKVDILWADAQGFEIEVMKGMGKFLPTVDFIHVEATQVPYYDGQPVVGDLQKFLTDNGFVIGEFSTPNYHPYGEGDLFVANSYMLTENSYTKQYGKKASNI